MRARRPDESYEEYRANLRKEQHDLKQRLAGTFRYISKAFYEYAATDEDGNILRDDVGRPVMKQGVRSFSPHTKED